MWKKEIKRSNATKSINTCTLYRFRTRKTCYKSRIRKATKSLQHRLYKNQWQWTLPNISIFPYITGLGTSDEIRSLQKIIREVHQKDYCTVLCSVTRITWLGSWIRCSGEIQSRFSNQGRSTARIDRTDKQLAVLYCCSCSICCLLFSFV